jgi:DNA-binding transcriptional LysR family regulator
MRCISGADTACVNLSRLDLNLLVALDALLEQRSVTKAAEKLGLSQPALSASLARLRRHFNDPLLARSGNSYQLTPLAVQLRERVGVALRSVERALSVTPSFDPVSSTREFRLVVSDYGAAVLGPKVAALLSAEAPQARLRFLPNTPSQVDGAAEVLFAAADLFIIPHGFITDLPNEDLYVDTWTCIIWEGNKQVGDRLTEQHLRTLPWVLTYSGPTASTPAARRLRMAGIEPRPQVVTDSFLAVPHLVSGTDRVALLQGRLADTLAPELGLRVHPSPVDVGELLEAMWWHPTFATDPEHAYLRGLVRRASQMS